MTAAPMPWPARLRARVPVDPVAARATVRKRLGMASRTSGWLAPAGAALRLRRQRWHQVEDDEAVARLLAAVAGQLRSGASLPMAVAGAVQGSHPTAVALGAAVAAHRRGLTFEATVARWVAARPTPAVRLAAATLTLGLAAGGDLGRACDAAAATLRQRAALRDEVRAQAAQARLSAVVVAVGPPAFTAVAAVADPEVGRFLVATPWGWSCLALGAACDVVGLLWMRRIVRGVGR